MLVQSFPHFKAFLTSTVRYCFDRAGMYLILMGAAVFLTSCSKPAETVIYTVAAGQNRCNHQQTKLMPQGNKLSIDVYVGETWFWEEISGVNGISKVTGLYWIHPHVNSIRLGWDGDQFCFYAYKNGTSPQKKPSLKGRMFKPTKGWYHFDIGWKPGVYFIACNERTWTTDAPDLFPGMPALSLPYVGGTYTLPFDWNVNLKIY